MPLPPFSRPWCHRTACLLTTLLDVVCLCASVVIDQFKTLDLNSVAAHVLPFLNASVICIVVVLEEHRGHITRGTLVCNTHAHQSNAKLS
jgi:hypothetical protein